MKKSVSSGFATHKIEQQSLTALSLPLCVNLSPTCKTCHNHALATVGGYNLQGRKVTKLM